MSTKHQHRAGKRGVKADTDPPYVPRTGLRPYRQGDLVGLCGIYAIINALRWASWPKEIDPDVAASLFAHLTKHALGRLKLKEMIAKGATTEKLNRLTQRAVRYLREKHGLMFKCEIIAAGQVILDPAKARSGKITPTCRQGEAFILDIDYDHGHWTVLARIEGGKVYFFDSAGHRPFRLDRFTLCGAVRIRRK